VFSPGCFFLAGRLVLVRGVVVPGQWRRIIGSYQKGATPKFKKLFKRGFFRQNAVLFVVFATFSRKQP
ncbi:hypothetical protein, partial [Serratia sp. 2723]|uniref:hypothetical protein n=1 Tax=unclassified Serratia (in: enterobacteria) TaxID=2647522 RepID=UPI003D2477D4